MVAFPEPLCPSVEAPAWEPFGCSGVHPCRHLQAYENKRHMAIDCDLPCPGSREFHEIPRIGVLGKESSPELELLLFDFQGLDPGLKGRRWKSKLSCRT
jgi:hypothetical protein